MCSPGASHWKNLDELEFLEFIHYLNYHNLSIRVKNEFKQDNIDFLDITIYKEPWFKDMDLKVFLKAKDTDCSTRAATTTHVLRESSKLKSSGVGESAPWEVIELLQLKFYLGA